MPQDPIAIIERIINNAIAVSEGYTDKSGNAADKILREKIGLYLDPPDTSIGFQVSAKEPIIPEPTDSYRQYEAQLNRLVALLSGQLADFLRTWFPRKNRAYEAAESWLIDEIENGGSGVNALVEEKLWQRARDKIIREGRRVEQQVTTAYASRGYPLPPGALLAKLDDIQLGQLAANGEQATQIAAEQYKAEIEMIKFAVEEALKLRMQAMNAALDYIRAIASMPDTALKTYNMKDENWARMLQAAATWYNALLNRDEIILKSKITEKELDYRIYEHRRTQATRNDQVKVQALGEAADVYARTASSALSSLNSIVQVASNV